MDSDDRQAPGENETSSQSNPRDIRAKLAKAQNESPPEADDDLVKNILSGEDSNQYDKRRQQEHDFRLQLAPNVIGWVSYIFFPAIFLLVLISGVNLEHNDAGWVFTYAIPPHVLWVAISSTVISVATVSGLLFKWVFRR